jgi:excisionase family DNA binding protein
MRGSHVAHSPTCVASDGPGMCASSLTARNPWRSSSFGRTAWRSASLCHELRATKKFSVSHQTRWYSIEHMTNTSEVIWLSRKDLAKRLGIPDKTPAEWATKGTGPKYARFGRHVRYRLSDVIAWEDQQFADLYGEQ